MQRLKRIKRARQRRVYHVRGKIRGSAERPRLAVYRSHRHISCQLINDDLGQTVVASSTQALLGSAVNGGNCSAAEKVGQDIAEKAKGAGIAAALVDRRWYKFHGRLRALIEAARKTGLKC